MKQDKEQNPKKKNSTIINVISIIISLILVALLVLFLFQSEAKRNSDENKIAYTDLVKEINNGNVEKRKSENNE